MVRPDGVPANAGEALSMLNAAFDLLSATDWAAMGCRVQGEVLAGLCGVQAKLTAVHAQVLTAFSAAGGYEPDGHGSARQWLIGRTGISKSAALGAVGWQKRLARHGRIAQAMAAGTVSESWAKQIGAWTDPLPADKRDEADRILLDAAAQGLPLEDLEVLARTIYETWKAQHPDPDDGNGDTGDEDGFTDRFLRLGTTFGGAGTVAGGLTAHCAAMLRAIFDSLGKRLGADDMRTVEQRQHDALAEALSRLIKADLLPESAGQATLAQVLISFDGLRRMPGASVLEQQWIDAQVLAGQPGWLTGAAAGAAVCDAKIAPVVTGSVDWQAVDQMADVWIAAHGLDRGPCGCTCGGCTCRPPAPMTGEAKARLRATLLALAADAMSGPGGLAAWLRGRLLQAPYCAKSLPLDVGKAAKDIPDHLRRAVILRDRHCAWPGGCDKPPAACQVHHIVPRSEGGKTDLRFLILLCDYHHQVCIHRLGWTLTLHADGTTQARSPHGEILRSHGPPASRAG
ncbi:MAG TPA: DUF222 domain-containing protein [Streptosporangiaceae bacterium]|nr:DUF222 domain-containing protein [Streptosporangiaceae bacterium]